MDRGSLKITVQTTTDLAESFAALAAADADRPLVLGRVGSTTRAEIDRLATDVAESAELPGAGTLVGVCATDGIAFLVAVLAVWRSGCVPLLIDADTPDARRAELASSLGAGWVLTCRSAAPSDASDFGLATMTGHDPARLPGTAVVKLSSGSTGRPRGILISPDALLADTAAIEAAMGIGEGDRVVAAVPMSYSYGLGSLAMPALHFGRQLVMPELGHPLDTLAAARRHSATVLPSVPSFLEALLKRSTTDLPESLRLILSAGAPLRPGSARRFRARVGKPIHVFYGASECGGICYDPTGLAAERGTVGRPIPGVRVHTDADTRLVSVRSPAVAAGFLPPNPALEDGCFHSLDEAVWDGEELRLIGRRGEAINVGGYKVNPREIEHAIHRMPTVQDVVVTPLEDADGSWVCCAIVESATARRRDVQAWCLANLPSWKLPRRIVVVPSLPRTSRGKVSAEAIRELAVVDGQGST